MGLAILFFLFFWFRYGFHSAKTSRKQKKQKTKTQIHTPRFQDCWFHGSCNLVFFCLFFWFDGSCNLVFFSFFGLMDLAILFFGLMGFAILCFLKIQMYRCCSFGLICALPWWPVLKVNHCQTSRECCYMLLFWAVWVRSQTWFPAARGCRQIPSSRTVSARDFQ